VTTIDWGMRFSWRIYTFPARRSPRRPRHRPNSSPFLAEQLELPPAAWEQYAARDETRREHAIEAQTALGLRPFTVTEYRGLRAWLTELALRTQKATAIAEQFIERLRTMRIVQAPPFSFFCRP
jgi:hypothetical protein